MHRHLVGERALEIELDSHHVRLISCDEDIGEARVIFGGSFNPPHYGHVALLELLLARFPSARITVVPAHHHAFGKSLVRFEDRMRWCRMIVESLSPAIELSDVESQLDGTSLATVRYFHDLEPTRRIVWVIGSDLLPTLPSWHQASSLSEIAEFAVFQREGARVDSGLLASSKVMPQVSSSQLRNDLKQDQVSGSALPALLKPVFLKENPYLDPR